uniref:Thyroglobulin type-1 domain-containing protein n=1 Tax=Salmo trutta TaxID=8032 RepID=A0A674AJ33_SALTR
MHVLQCYVHITINVCYLCPDAGIRPMTPCERARYAATHAYIPTCDAAGRYTPKQCSGSTGYCWCVTTTGQKIQGTETPPGTASNCSTKMKGVGMKSLKRRTVVFTVRQELIHIPYKCMTKSRD